MDDEQTRIDGPEAPSHRAWGDSIAGERQQYLWAKMQAWWDEPDHGERCGPFAV